MIAAYSVDDVRGAEESAMATLPEGELMSRASRGLAAVAAARLRARGGSRVVALTGAGNNGADALYAVARLATEGFTAAAVTAAAGVHEGSRRAAVESGATVLGADDPRWRSLLEGADLVLDGITGIGGRPGLSGEGRRWVDAVPPGAWVIAVDLPSGTDPSGEQHSDSSVFADETVTFAAPKPVHLLPVTEPAVGRLTVIDIGLDVTPYRPAVERLTHDDVARLWPVPAAGDDKYSRGVVGIVAGSLTYPGAGVLSVLGCLGAGPGMVRFLGPAAVHPLVHLHAPEAVTTDGRVQAWVVGSGWDPTDDSGDGVEQRRRVEAALASDLPVLADAGALALVGPRAAPTLLTPHAGELADLLTRLGEQEVTRAEVTREPLRHAREAADRTGATVLLKGWNTLVVPPPSSHRAIRSQADAPAWLATAGAGDVLGGVIGTLLAAGLDPVDAGSLGALVHGVAADRTNPGGPVRARDLAHGIPAAVAALLARR